MSKRPHLHFWIPEAAPAELDDWDPDTSPEMFADGLGHNLFELSVRLVRRGWPISIGPTTPRNAVAVVAFAKSLIGMQRRIALFRQAFALPLLVIKSDVVSSWPTGFRPTLEVTPTQTDVVAPWQRSLLPLPQRGLIPRDVARRGTVSSVGYKGNPEHLPDFARTDEWKTMLAALGLEWLPDMPSADGSRPARWHDFRTVDIAFCVRNDSAGPRKSKPPTKLLNAWNAGAIPIASREAGYMELAKDGVDAIFADTEAETIAALKRLVSSRRFVAGLESAIAEQARTFAPDRILGAWEETLSELARTKVSRSDKAYRLWGVSLDILGGTRRRLTRDLTSPLRTGG